MNKENDKQVLMDSDQQPQPTTANEAPDVLVQKPVK
jgi:hypothetical protein